jgi:trehalose 6-phosphate phosphatase
MELSEIVDAVRSVLPRVLLTIDFDGTLAPLVDDPETSRAAPGAVTALADLAAAGVEIVVITGREALTAVRLGPLDSIQNLTVIGVYGAETWSHGKLMTRETPPSLPAIKDRLVDLVQAADADPALWVEDKRLSLVVHARRAEHPQEALAHVEQAVQSLADEVGLDVHRGRDVLELRLPGLDKGESLARLLTERDPALVLYIGDDLGDVPAFTEIRAQRSSGRRAYGIGVLSTSVEEIRDVVDATLDTPADVVELLRALATAGADARF